MTFTFIKVISPCRLNLGLICVSHYLSSITFQISWGSAMHTNPVCVLYIFCIAPYHGNTWTVKKYPKAVKNLKYLHISYKGYSEKNDRYADEERYFWECESCLINLYSKTDFNFFYWIWLLNIWILFTGNAPPLFFFKNQIPFLNLANKLSL